jgi:hypothetical protein
MIFFGRPWAARLLVPVAFGALLRPAAVLAPLARGAAPDLPAGFAAFFAAGRFDCALLVVVPAAFVPDVRFAM